MIVSLLAAALVIGDVTVVDVERGKTVPHRTVVLRGDTIESVGPAASAVAPADAERIDGRGKYLIPGLIDAHVHLTILDKGALAKGVLLPMFLRHGVTGVRDMGGDPSQLMALRDGVARGELAGPRIVTPGPFLDGAGEPPVTRVVATAADAPGAVAEVRAAGADFVKVQAALSPTAWSAILAAAAELGLAVAGHVPESVSAFDVAASGQRTIEHVSPVLPGDAGVMMACSADEPGLRAGLVELGAYAAREDAILATYRAMQRDWTTRLIAGYDDRRCAALAKRLRKHRVAWVPTQVWGRAAYPVSAEDAPREIDPAIPEPIRRQWGDRRTRQIAGSTPEDYAVRAMAFDAAKRLVASMHARGVTILAGTDGIDAFDTPGDALHRELGLLVDAGLTPAAALRAATWDAARVLGWTDAGRVVAGARADLVLLEADPLADIGATRRIAEVIAGGRRVPRE